MLADFDDPTVHTSLVMSICDFISAFFHVGKLFE